MTSQDVIAEIRSLKSELNTFNDHMVRLRYEDLKGAFLDQMRMAVGEEGKRAFHDDVGTLHDSSDCELKAVCLRKLDEAVEGAASLFMKDDLPGARKILDEVEGLIKGDCSPCQDGGCSRTAAETLRRVRAILQVYESLVERFGPGTELRLERHTRAHELVPEDAEAVLDPLANAWRIKVLATLRRGERSLSELGRALELRTGHLQFHLRVLVDAGFVALDRRRHRYSLTERGALALDCAEDMVKKLGPAPSDQNDKGAARTGDGREPHAF